LAPMKRGRKDAPKPTAKNQARRWRFCMLKKTLGRFVSQSGEGVSTEVVVDFAKDLEGGVDWLVEDMLRCRGSKEQLLMHRRR